jgi:hypothetical protein
MFCRKVSGGLSGVSEHAASGQPKQARRAIPMSLLMALMISDMPFAGGLTVVPKYQFIG